MKKQFKALIVIAVIAVLCAAAAACSGGDNAAVGKWNLESGDILGQNFTADELGAANPDLANTSVEFKANGTYTLVFGGESGTGSYKLDGSTITLDDVGATVFGEISGDTLTLDLTPVAGIDAIMTFKKA